MHQLHKALQDTLQRDERLVIDGRLNKNKIVEMALALDVHLLSLLMENALVRAHFFRQVNDTWVFDKIDFQHFVSHQQFLPDSYTAFKNKIGLTVNGQYLTESQEVNLAWPYKDCVLEGGQTKEAQAWNEVFWNKTLAPDEIDRLFDPKVLTHFRKYDEKGVHELEDLSMRDNLIVKGNNLLGLHSLKSIYAGRVKLIYIDPPYNTGGDDFRYNDRFSHSSWLTFMANRLSVAREWMAEDGFIVIQIDNHEGAYLRVLCDEIFGRQNYRNTIIAKKGMKSLQKQFTKIQHLNAGFDSLFLYTKNESTRLPNLFKALKGPTASSWNNHWRGTNRRTMRYEIFGIKPKSGQWRWEQTRTLRAIDNYQMLIDYIKMYEGAAVDIGDDLIDQYYLQYLNEHDITDHADFELVRLSKHGNPEHYIPPRTQVLLSENWMDLNVAGRVTRFEHEKSEALLQRIIEWLTAPKDLVLDFFLGSGATAAVAHKLDRQYIGLEQMDYAHLDAVHRLQTVIRGDAQGISKTVGWTGGGSFVYAELAQLNAKWLKEIERTPDEHLVSLYHTLKSNPYLIYHVDLAQYSAHASAFESLPPDIQRQVLRDLLDMNQLYLNLSEIEDQAHAIPEHVVQLNRKLYKMSST